ncbi:MAG: ankyrin repeat domain-containing protein [Treponema sp.]|nr:ankyrin repeat domain-containing protein [Treponema sp.]
MKTRKILLTAFIALAIAFSAVAVSTKEKLFKACETGSYKELKSLLKSYSSAVNSKRSPSGETLLMAALKEDRDLEIIKLLLKWGADPTKKNKNGQTGVMYAAMYSTEPDVVNAVVRAGTIFNFQRKSRINKKDKKGKSSYDYAVERGEQEIIDVLTKYAPQKNTQKTKSQAESSPDEVTENVPAEQAPAPSIESQAVTAASVAVSQAATVASAVTAEQGSESEAPAEPETKLVKTGKVVIKIDKNGAEYLDEETKEVRQTPAANRIEGEADESSEEPAETATAQQAPQDESVTVEEVNIAPVKPAIEPKVQVFGNFTTPVPPAPVTPAVVTPPEPAPVESVESKIQPVPQIKPFNKTYLYDYEELESDDTPVVEDNNYDPYHTFIEDANRRDLQGRTPLMKAAKNGDLKLVENLIYSGAVIDAQDNDGWTALMFAARFSTNANVTKTLIRNGADTDIKNNYGISALRLSAGFNSNSNVTAQLLSGHTPAESEVRAAFIYAITNGASTQTLDLFWDKGLSINSPYDGKTPLMYAAESNKDTKIIAWLLNNGAKTSYMTTTGLKAFDYAKANKHLPHDRYYWAMNENDAATGSTGASQ